MRGTHTHIERELLAKVTAAKTKEEALTAIAAYRDWVITIATIVEAASPSQELVRAREDLRTLTNLNTRLLDVTRRTYLYFLDHASTTSGSNPKRLSHPQEVQLGRDLAGLYAQTKSPNPPDHDAPAPT